MVLDPACLRDWLNPEITDRTQLRAVTHRLDPEQPKAIPVSPEVNNPRHNSPDLIREA